MALETFDPPLAPSTVSDAPEVKILKAEFGDGYSQSSADGLNHIRMVRTLTWDALYPYERNEIISFFRARAGHQPFYFVLDDLDENPVKWTCERWSESSVSGGYMKIDAEFRQSFSIAT